MGWTVKVVFAGTSCIFAFVFCIITMGQLIFFLSAQKPLAPHKSIYFRNEIYKPLKTDVVWLSLFVVLHWSLPWKLFKRLLVALGLETYERLLFNFISCLSLQLLMINWCTISVWPVWDVARYKFASWIFFIVHVLAWLLLYGGCLIMDFSELMGIKQIYHNVKGLPVPITLKSEGLQKLYLRMRHPSLCAMTMLLFFHPVMYLDRFLLAHTLTLFSLFRCPTDAHDYNYQRKLLARKKQELGST